MNTGRPADQLGRTEQGLLEALCGTRQQEANTKVRTRDFVVTRNQASAMQANPHFA